jgi:L-seryl-tRNA(Ser) seleniumtransferase
MKQHDKLALLPSVDALLNHHTSVILSDRVTHEFLREKFRSILTVLRDDIEKGGHKQVRSRDEFIDIVMGQVQNQLESLFKPCLKSVINASGVILHTGLGRAPLSEAAQRHVMNVIRGYSNLEIDLQNGKRGDRTRHVTDLICQLTGAEAATVVNNNAAAVFLTLNALSYQKEAIISRGEQIEIGGSFRMPDVMGKSGAIMREVGTTNKTKLSDYRNAFSDDTGVVVVAHTSNYRVMGFTESVVLKDLVEMTHAHGFPLYHDLGGGVLLDLRRFGLPYEPLVQDSLAAGADVVSFSGDKVLGGPQSGIIVGKKKWIDKLQQNPIMRAVRCCKMTYAALEATCKLFLTEKDLMENHKVMQLFTYPVDKLFERAGLVVDLIKNTTIDISVESSFCQAGSGTMPLEKIASCAIVIKSRKLSAQDIFSKLLSNDPPVIGYIRDEYVFLDMRTVDDEQIGDVAQAVSNI